MKKAHWNMYLKEFLGTAILLFVGLTGTLLAAQSGLPAVIEYLIIGLSFAAAIVFVSYSFLGKESGGHINPALTLAFWMGGLMENIDAAFYVIAQLVGAALGAWLSFLVFKWDAASLALTLPSSDDPTMTLLAEIVLSFLLVTLIWGFMSSEQFGKYTGLAVGIYIVFVTVLFAPIAGPNLNPAVTLAPAILLGDIKHLPLYFAGPTVGAAITVYLYQSITESRHPRCCKLCYKTDAECVFKCACEYKPSTEAEVMAL
ncbi:MIP/aquaporin family protein [Candidatus Hydrogenedentota bacterium]